MTVLPQLMLLVASMVLLFIVFELYALEKVDVLSTTVTMQLTRDDFYLYFFDRKHLLEMRL